MSVSDSFRRIAAMVFVMGACLPLRSFGSGAGEAPDASDAPTGAAWHFANADDVASVRAGKALYAAHCARCHGRRLEGQPLWQLQDQFAGMRAPAHDDTGHTWQHSDEELWLITRSGRAPRLPAGEKSSMPPFAARLSDAQILQVVAYIKARWSRGIRIAQATLNPDFAGMPQDADDVDWRLPPNCSSTLQSWRAGAR